jgi:hypothetical protein
MQTARQAQHTKYRCMDLVSQFTEIPDPNDPFHQTTTWESTVSTQDAFGTANQEVHAKFFSTLAENAKTEYMTISWIAEGLKLVQGAITGGWVGLAVGFFSGIWGITQAKESADEIFDSFLKGEKWCKQVDTPWSYVIGATKDTTIIASRIAWPSPDIRQLPEPDAMGNYPRVNVEVTYSVTRPNDGIVGSPTQESPQERGWRGGSSVSGLNLEANKVDHFSQANHPRVRERLEATMRGQTTRTNIRVIDAFKVD